MNLVWKLLRQHISIPQFAGFFFANLFGMLIVLLGWQFYKDVAPVFTAEDSFMKSDFLIVNKKIGTANTINGRSNTFTNEEIDDLSQQPFVSSVGKFTNTAYKVDANMSVNGTPVLNNGEISFESIPDKFVDTKMSNWKYTPGDKVVPIILPRIYLTMYNFGFAQSHSLPKISDGLVGMIDFSIFIHPGDQQFTKYLDRKGYEIENDKLNAEKTTYFLRLMVTMVMIVGLIISILSFYILMLSIYLLVQKNSSKLENLLLIGYKPTQVARPYQLLTIGLNIAVLVIALVVLYFVRNYYMDVIETLFPDIEDGSMIPALTLGSALLVMVSLCNLIAIRNKIVRIWKRKD